MSISNISFDKRWTNPQDFSTVQNDEVKVREDQQYLFDFIANYINNTLIPQITEEIASIVIEGIADGSITTSKFNASAVAPAAQKWSAVRNLKIADADASHEGVAIGVDGSAAATLRLPSVIRAALNGNADTATSAGKWATGRGIKIQDADGTNVGESVTVDGSGNVILKLPGTIKATLSGNATYATSAGSAGSATNADYATSAGSATNATNATDAATAAKATNVVLGSAHYGTSAPSTLPTGELFVVYQP